MEEDYEATWIAVTEAFVELNDTLTQIQDDYENREEVGSWEEYAAAWEEIAEELIATKGKTKETILKDIRRKQNNLVKHDAFPRGLSADDFPDSDKIDDKTIESLVDYTTMLKADKQNITYRIIKKYPIKQSSHFSII